MGATQTEHHGRDNATATTIVKSWWGPHSGIGSRGILGNMAVALHAGVRDLLRRCQHRQGNGGAAADLEKPQTVEAVPLWTPCKRLVRAVPACGHGFHARCIERWLAAGGRRSSCPTCRAPASTPPPPAPAPAGVPAPAATS